MEVQPSRVFLHQINDSLEETLLDNEVIEVALRILPNIFNLTNFCKTCKRLYKLKSVILNAWPPYHKALLMQEIHLSSRKREMNPIKMAMIDATSKRDEILKTLKCNEEESRSYIDLLLKNNTVKCAFGFVEDQVNNFNNRMLVAVLIQKIIEQFGYEIGLYLIIQNQKNEFGINYIVEFIKIGCSNSTASSIPADMLKHPFIQTLTVFSKCNPLNNEAAYEFVKCFIYDYLVCTGSLISFKVYGSCEYFARNKYKNCKEILPMELQQIVSMIDRYQFTD